MATPRKTGIGVDGDTVDLLAKLEKATGVSRREHLRRAVQRYFDQAAEHLTEAAANELLRMPATEKEIRRASAGRVVASNIGPVLKKKLTH